VIIPDKMKGEERQTLQNHLVKGDGVERRHQPASVRRDIAQSLQDTN